MNSHLFNCHFKVTHFHPAASIFKVRHHRGVRVFFSWKSLTPTLNMKNSGDFDPISKCLLRKKKLPTYLFLAKCLYRHCKQRHLFSRKLIDVFRFQYVQEIFTNFLRILISYLWWFFWPIEKIQCDNVTVKRDAHIMLNRKNFILYTTIYIKVEEDWKWKNIMHT